MKTTLLPPLEAEKPIAQPAAQPRWIWSSDTGDYHVWCWARRRFHLDESSASALLEITADLRYDLWVNGKWVGFGPPRYHYETPTLDRYDLTPWLEVGESNTLAIRVYSLAGAPISSCMPRRGALWCRLTLGKQRIVSDENWRMCRDRGYAQEAARKGSDQPPNEVYDARQGLGPAWERDYEDRDWPTAQALEVEPYPFEPRDIPHPTLIPAAPERALESGIMKTAGPYAQEPIGRVATHLAQATLFPARRRFLLPAPGSAHLPATPRGSNQASYLVWDLGKLWTGYPSLTASGEEGTIIDLCYAEHLSEGRVDPMKGRMHYFDRVILGKGELNHTITWPKCARYIMAVAHGGAANVEFRWFRSAYPVIREGMFASSSPALDHAVEISLHTVELCMEDSYLDTPWRERGAWLGDDLIKARVAYAYFGDLALARRFLLHHARGQEANGQMKGKYPGNTTSHVSTWTLAYPPSVLEYCRESSDWELARGVWLNIVGLMSWVLALRNTEGLLEAPATFVDAETNRYNFIDWAPIDLRGANAAWNAFGYQALRCAAELASQIGKDEAAREWTSHAETLRHRFQHYFWDQERGIFCNGRLDGKPIRRWGSHENVLALLFDLATDEQKQSLTQKLEVEGWDSIFIAHDHDYDEELPGYGKISTVSLALSRYRWPDEKMVPIGTPYFAMYQLEAWCREGRMEEVQRYIDRHWGEFARQGGSSVWETWDRQQSLSHAWSCAPAVLAQRWMAGVRWADARGTALTILPNPGTLTFLRVRVATRHGIVQVEWREGTLLIDLPQGLRAEAGLPTASAQAQLLLDRQPIPARECHATGRRYLTTSLTAGHHELTLLPSA